jgi:hypothetical protein
MELGRSPGRPAQQRSGQMADMAVPAREKSETGAWLAMGSLLVAGTIMIMVGMFQVFEGITAIFSNAFYTVPAHYAFNVNVGAWGWLHLLLGILLVAGGGYLFVGKLWARILAIILALVSAWSNFLYIPYYPIWSILIIALDVLIIWAVVAYGRELAD